MTPFGLQTELVEDQGRDLAGQRHESASPVRLEAQMPAQTETLRGPACSPPVVAFFVTIVDLTTANVAFPTIGVKPHLPQSDLQCVVAGEGLRVHDHVVRNMAARHCLHEPVRSGDPRLGAPR